MKKVLGIAFAVLIVASIGAALLISNIWQHDRDSFINLIHRPNEWPWINIPLFLETDHEETIYLDRKENQLPIQEGDTLRVSTSYGEIKIIQSDNIQDEVLFSLSGDLPAHHDWHIQAEKTDQLALYTLEVPAVILNGSNQTLYLEVHVPRDLTLDLDLSTHVGEITVLGDYGNVNMINQLGAVRFEGSSNNMTFHLNLGDADIQLDDFKEIHGAVDLGNIHLAIDDDIDNKHYILETNLGSIQKDAHFYDTIGGDEVRLSTDLGDIQLERR